MRRTHKKILRRSLLIPLALLFMLEAWLWDKTGALIARLIVALPLEAFKQRVSRAIEALSPIQTLCIFIIPVLVLLPIKIMALWFLAHGWVVAGIGTIIAAKLAGLGVSSYLFTLCKPKLLLLGWVRWLYEHCLHWRELAAKLVRPYTNFIHQYRKKLARRFPRSKLVEKLRARMHKARQSP